MVDKVELSPTDLLADLVAPQKIIALIIGFIIMAVIVRLINGTSNKIETSYPSHRLLALQIGTILNFSIYILGTFALVYAVIQPPKELLFAVGGSAAVAIGFALKDLVSSIIAGLILLFDRPFQVGDRVTFADTYGEIVSIGLRAVRLTTLDDNLVTIPNSKFLTDIVASGNAGALDMMVCVDFLISANADLRRARELLYEVVATSKYVYIKKPIRVVLTEKTQGQFIWIELKVKAYVLDVIYEKAFQTDIVLRGTEVLNLNNIQRPSIHYVNNKEILSNELPR
jgi:small-conductance mechanosensitive channel